MDKKWIGRIRSACLLCVLLFSASVNVACGASELEEKSLPLLAGVEKQDSGTGAIEIIYVPAAENKVLDYNHLKVMVFEEAFLMDEKQYTELLKQLREEMTFPRNVYACVTKDIDALIDCEYALDDDIGSYIEELLEHTPNVKAKALPTIGKLMDDLSNRRKKLDIPYLSVENGTITWSGYYRIEKSVPLYKLPDAGNTIE